MLFMADRLQGILWPPWLLVTNSKCSLTSYLSLGLKLFETCCSTISARLSCGRDGTDERRSPSSEQVEQLFRETGKPGTIPTMAGGELQGRTKAVLLGDMVFPTGTKTL